MRNNIRNKIRKEPVIICLFDNRKQPEEYTSFCLRFTSPRKAVRFAKKVGKMHRDVHKIKVYKPNGEVITHEIL